MAKTWYPIIDRDRCIDCGTCVEFCPHGVYTRNGECPEVTAPESCVEFCRGCAKICPAEAIRFHGDEES